MLVRQTNADTYDVTDDGGGAWGSIDWQEVAAICADAGAEYVALDTSAYHSVGQATYLDEVYVAAGGPLGQCERCREWVHASCLVEEIGAAVCDDCSGEED